MDAHFASALRDDAVGEKRRFVSLRAAKGGDLCPAGVSNLLVGKEWMDCFGADAPRNDTSRFPVFHLTHNLLVLPEETNAKAIAHKIGQGGGKIRSVRLCIRQIGVK
jgi:hypothetical protein